MTDLLQDIRFSWRLFRSNPGFTVVIILILGLGIGAAGTIFSIVNELLIRPLPYREPDRIVALWDTQRQNREGIRQQVTYLNFLDWRSQNRVFDEMAALTYGNANFSGSGVSRRVSGLSVTEGYFRVLGIQPVLGRTFLTEECASDASRAVILSHGFWLSQFGGRRDIVGQVVRLDGYSFTVVGVMPVECSGLFTFMGEKYDPELWTPITPKPWQAYRGNHSWFAIARLKPGVTLERAQADMDVIANRLAAQYPDADKGWSIIVTGLQESLFGSTRPALLSLAGAVGFVLLIACVNVANLLLGQALARGKEVAIRTALGASRSRIVRQMLTEGLMLSLLGGAAGLLVAAWSIDFINTFVSESRFTIARIRLDGQVVAFSFLAAMLVSVLVGLAPAISGARVNLNQNLKEGGRGASGGPGKNRLSNLLVVVEVMLSLVLLTGAGLLTKSFIHLWGIDLGFRTERILTMSLALSGPRHAESGQVADFYRQLLDRVRAIPGVDSAGITSRLPLEGMPGTRFNLDGRTQPSPGQWPVAGYLRVSPEYFGTVGIPILKGRHFTPQDNKGSQNVVIISDSLARRYWEDQDPTGKRLWHTADGQGVYAVVIGVAANHRQEGLEKESRPIIYLPHAQCPDSYMSIAVRTQTDPASLTGAIQKEMYELDPDQPPFDVRTMEQGVSLYLAQRRLVLMLMGTFAAAALVLAVIGIYGVVSYSVSQRTQEIGLRMAIGARPGDVLRMVLGRGLRLILAGAGLGIAASLGLTRLLSSQLYGIRPTDPWTFFVAALLLVAASLVACYLPARGAMRIDPMSSLKAE